MKIENVDFFYLSMPEILDIGDGSQDALLVRVQSGDWEGWGECEAAPLPSIAAWCCPKSHSACKPVRDSVLNQGLNEVADIIRIGDLVRENSLDLLQAEHTLSGIDMALWDLLGKKLEQPVYKLLGYKNSFSKNPYASVLFGDMPEETLQKARNARAMGYQAGKFGWGPIGRTTVEADREQFHAAREGLGDDGILLVDAGTVWIDDVEAAAARLPALEECGAVWLEEPFVSGAIQSYAALAKQCKTVKLAGGEGSHNVWMARQMMQHGGVGFIQIDAGRIGGISVSKQVADDAAAQGVTYVNHTFTSHLALSASLQPFAGLEHDVICEYPVEPKLLAVEMTQNHVARDENGHVRAPESPGLGIAPDLEAIKKYLVPLEISVRGATLYQTPQL